MPETNNKTAHVGAVYLHHVRADDIEVMNANGSWWLDLGPVSIFVDGPRGALDLAVSILHETLSAVPDDVLAEDRDVAIALGEFDKARVN